MEEKKTDFEEEKGEAKSLKEEKKTKKDRRNSKEDVEPGRLRPGSEAEKERKQTENKRG